MGIESIIPARYAIWYALKRSLPLRLVEHRWGARPMALVRAVVVFDHFRFLAKLSIAAENFVERMLSWHFYDCRCSGYWN